MAAKTDFTAEEWDALQKGVSGAGMMVSLADPGFFDTFKEIGALTKHLAEAQTKSTNPLIGEIAKIRGTGFGLASTPQEIETQTVEALKSRRTFRKRVRLKRSKWTALLTELRSKTPPLK